MTGGMGKAKVLNASSVPVKACSQTSPCTSMVSGQRQPSVGEQQVKEFLHKLDVFKSRVPYETHSRVLIHI